MTGSRRPISRNASPSKSSDRTRATWRSTTETSASPWTMQSTSAFSCRISTPTWSRYPSTQKANLRTPSHFGSIRCPKPKFAASASENGPLGRILKRFVMQEPLGPAAVGVERTTLVSERAASPAGRDEIEPNSAICEFHDRASEGSPAPHRDPSSGCLQYWDEVALHKGVDTRGRAEWEELVGDRLDWSEPADVQVADRHVSPATARREVVEHQPALAGADRQLLAGLLGPDHGGHRLDHQHMLPLRLRWPGIG